MTPSSWQRLMDLFERASRLPVEEQPAFLQRECGGDEDLQENVRRMLEEDSRSGDFLAPPDPEDLERASGTAAAPVQTGMRLGQYTLERPVGSGGMGTVYEATQDRPRRTVALKVMNSRFVSTAARRRFRFEAEILARLHHPGIAQVLEAGLFEDETTGVEVPFFAMEFVSEARTLLQYVRDEQMDIKARLRLFLRVCEAVSHGHQKGVIHRDLKPANILVNADGDPKVIDFGVARATDSDVQLTTLHTDLRQVLGTLQYMSPEQLEGDPDQLDTRTDEYSLGVILYELLCDRLPYDLGSKALHEVSRIVHEEAPRRPSSHQRALRGDLEVIVLTALEKEKARRYDSVEAMARDIERFLQRIPIHARKPSALYQVRLFATRNRLWVGAATIVLCALVAASVVSTRFGFKAVQAQDRLSQQLEEVYRLSDRVLVEGYLSDALTLWPRWPERIPAMDQWLADAKALLGRVPEHRSILERLEQTRSQTEPSDQPPEGMGDDAPGSAQLGSDHARLEWRITTSIDLLQRLEELESTFQDVAARRAYADTTMRTHLTESEDAWDEAIDDIALSETYDGLELAVQVGLVPLEPDFDTGLWEFWLPETGARPERDGDRWIIGEETGMVFVLLPGGEVFVGAQAEDPNAPYHDATARDNEALQRVTLDPFFLSRYEMTQGQWLRLTGSNPSHFTRTAEGLPTLDHPVEEVSQELCFRILPRAGLSLPTEVQWEYGARAGSSTRWWTGSEARSLEGAANLADQAYAREFVEPRTLEAWLDDGYPRTAPVGTFRPNAFGLHDVVGNVWEWCSDAYWADVAPRPGDGLRAGDGEAPGFAALRGGSFANGALSSRSFGRAFDAPGALSDLVGVRPARRIH